MAYDPKTNYDIGGLGPIKGWNDLYWNSGFNDNQASLACDTFAQCQGYVLDNSGALWLQGAGRRAGTNPNQKNGDKKNPPPIAKYTGKPITAATSIEHGARAQDSANGSNCGGFNGYGDWKGKPLQGFGANYNGQCPSSFILSYCPPELGRPVAGNYANRDGTACNSGGAGCSGGSLTSDLLRKCDYSSMNMAKFINAGIFNENLGTQILTDASWAQAKLDYCSLAANIDTSECKNYFSDSRTGTSWNTVKLGFCAGTSTGTEPTCLTTINNVFKSTLSRDDVNKQVASNLVRNFCAADPTSDKCACWNATQNGYNCISDASKSTLPGCVALKRDFGSLPSSASVVSADTFCASNDCVGRALRDAVFMPAARAPSQSCPSIQACIQSFNNANLTGAQIDASCEQTLNITPGTTPSGTTPSGTTPTTTPSGTTPTTTPSGTPTTTPSGTPTAPDSKEGLWSLDAIPGVNTKPKQIGFILCILFFCCCCLVIIGFAAMSGGGGSAAPAAPVGPSAANLAQERMAYAINSAQGRLGALLSKV